MAAAVATFESTSTLPRGNSAATTQVQAVSKDRELTQRAIDGDRQAFDALVRKHYARAIRLAEKVVGTSDDAQDVVQEAFVRVHRRLPDFRADSAFYTWLYRIVMNLSIDWVRKRKRERRADIEDQRIQETLGEDNQLWPSPDSSCPQRQVEMDELRASLSQSFSKLPEIHRDVLRLREVEGLSYTELATQLGVKKGTVMSRLFHARKTMQKSLVV